jgi:hypothetical protein
MQRALIALQARWIMTPIQHKHAWSAFQEDIKQNHGRQIALIVQQVLQMSTLIDQMNAALAIKVNTVHSHRPRALIVQQALPTSTTVQQHHALHAHGGHIPQQCHSRALLARKARQMTTVIHQHNASHVWPGHTERTHGRASPVLQAMWITIIQEQPHAWHANPVNIH